MENQFHFLYPKKILSDGFIFKLNKLRHVSTRMVCTILVCSTYSTYTVRIGTSKKGGNAPRATDKKSTICVGGKYFNPPQASVLV
jgi:hypothetical protein